MFQVPQKIKNHLYWSLLLELIMSKWKGMNLGGVEQSWIDF